MPQGSKPGERRGGRQRGTPNKKTVLKNAAILAAEGKPNSSPLDFMLGLMRDPNLPTDLRVDMAARAAPFIHIKPRKGTAPAPGQTSLLLNSANEKAGLDSNAQKMDAQLNPALQTSIQDSSPLAYLFSVMRDPDVDPQLQIKAARIAAEYVHERKGHARSLIKDPYGFVIDPFVAMKIQEYQWQEHLVDMTAHTRPKNTFEDQQKLKDELYGKARELAETIECPPAYPQAQYTRDGERLEELYRKRSRNNGLPREENAEEAHLHARTLAYTAKLEREGPLRLKELEHQKLHGQWSEELQIKLDRLERRYGDPASKLAPLEEIRAWLDEKERLKRAARKRLEHQKQHGQWSEELQMELDRLEGPASKPRPLTPYEEALARLDEEKRLKRAAQATPAG